MATIQTWFDQELFEPVHVHYLDGNVFSADNAGNIVGFRMYDRGSPATLTGSVSASIIRSDGVTVSQPGTLDNNKVYVALPQAAYVVPGVISVVIKLTSGSTITTMGALVANVYQSTTDTVVDPGTIIPSVENLIAAIEAAIASIPADYSSLWNQLAPTFSTSTAYTAGQYVTYNGAVYRFRNDHSGTWSSTDVVNITLGNDLEYARNFSKPIEDAIYTIGTDDDCTVQLAGQIVPYRYQQTTINTNHTSIRFTLPENVKTVDISMYGLTNMNSYTFLDANDNILFYKYEQANGDVSYEGLNAWEAKYLVCSNNSSYINTIKVTAHIRGVGAYIDEAKKAVDENYTLLSGTISDVYYYDFTQSTGNYTIIYDVTDFDYVDITSYNTAVTNKYTFLDSNDNIVGYYRPVDESEIQATTTVKVSVPANAAQLYVSTYRVQRPNVLVYGVKMPSYFEWVNLGGVFVDYRYGGETRSERTNGSKEFAASQFDILRLADGGPVANVNAFTALDNSNNVLGYISLHAEDITDETYFICPRGTTKVAVAGAAFASGGWTTCTPLAVQKLKTTKKLSVMGDSISTFKGFSPDDYNPFYMSGRDGLPNASYSYWGIVAREKGWGLSTINAWGGSQVAFKDGRTEIPMCDDRRAGNLAVNGTPDIIIILGGTNDFGHGVPVGTWAGDADLPEEETNFRAAYARMLMKIHSYYPLAKVYCCTLLNRETDLVPGSMEKKYGQYLTAFNTAIRQIAPMLNCTLIDLESCGMNQYNMETYMADYDPTDHHAVHPNIAGHKLMAERILNSLI